MNMLRASVLVLSLVPICGLAACESDQSKSSPAAPLSVERSAHITATAKVKAIDYVTRRVTLEGTDGKSITITAGKDVQRLNEVKPGDTVEADYEVSLLAELRPATADETANPITVVEIAGRTPQGSAPGAGAGWGTRIVTTVQAVDQQSMLVTLKGPMGDTVTVRGQNPDNVRRLKVGDTIVITYTEAMAVSLVKRR